MEKQKQKNPWKVTAIIFICLYFGLIAFMSWGDSMVVDEEKQTNICYYDVCGEYPEAWYEAEVCTCYDYDEYGEYEVVKTKYMG